MPQSLLVFKSGLRTGDYHGEMNSDNFIKWIKTQLIPNLPSRSVVVMDNASYHNTESDKPPTSNSRKEIMKQWLDSKGVPYSLNDTKIELYEKIKEVRPKTSSYVVDTLLSEYGHSAIRLPPYHPELNPIENIWGILKNWVATRNVSFKLDDVKRLVEEKCANIGGSEWESVCAKAKRIEEDYVRQEVLTDELQSEFVINLESDDSSEEDEMCGES